MIPVHLPLDVAINRCLAHGHFVGDWCAKRYECACHETIKHDIGLSVPAAYRKCNSDRFISFIPLTGFPSRDEADDVR